MIRSKAKLLGVLGLVGFVFSACGTREYEDSEIALRKTVTAPVASPAASATKADTTSADAAKKTEAVARSARVPSWSEVITNFRTKFADEHPVQAAVINGAANVGLVGGGAIIGIGAWRFYKKKKKAKADKIVVVAPNGAWSGSAPVDSAAMPAAGHDQSHAAPDLHATDTHAADTHGAASTKSGFIVGRIPGVRRLPKTAGRLVVTTGAILCGAALYYVASAANTSVKTGLNNYFTTPRAASVSK